MDFHRYYVPGTAVFITLVVQDRQPVFRDTQMVELLRSILRTVKDHHTFTMLAYVFLPDHFHLLIRPTGENNFSQIMHSLKTNFTKQYKRLLGIKESESLKFWQKRFWDHIIRDERDLENHLHYIHFNPVKHGLIVDPRNWA
jgi:putative transposase